MAYGMQVTRLPVTYLLEHSTVVGRLWLRLHSRTQVFLVTWSSQTEHSFHDRNPNWSSFSLDPLLFCLYQSEPTLISQLEWWYIPTLISQLEWWYIPTLEVTTLVMFVLFQTEAAIRAILSMEIRSFEARLERDNFEKHWKKLWKWKTFQLF